MWQVMCGDGGSRLDATGPERVAAVRPLAALLPEVLARYGLGDDLHLQVAPSARTDRAAVLPAGALHAEPLELLPAAGVESTVGVIGASG